MLWSQRVCKILVVIQRKLWRTFYDHWRRLTCRYISCEKASLRIRNTGRLTGGRLPLKPNRYTRSSYTDIGTSTLEWYMYPKLVWAHEWMWSGYTYLQTIFGYSIPLVLLPWADPITLRLPMSQTYKNPSNPALKQLHSYGRLCQQDTLEESLWNLFAGWFYWDWSQTWRHCFFMGPLLLITWYATWFTFCFLSNPFSFFLCSPFPYWFSLSFFLLLPLSPFLSIYISLSLSFP